jgi:hypothetical protein
VNIASGKNGSGLESSALKKQWKHDIMTIPSDIAGTAALAICEALLLALNDRQILPEFEIVGILTDAAAAHDSVPEHEGLIELHLAVSKLINQIISSGNSVRRKPVMK